MCKLVSRRAGRCELLSGCRSGRTETPVVAVDATGKELAVASVVWYCAVKGLARVVEMLLLGGNLGNPAINKRVE